MENVDNKDAVVITETIAPAVAVNAQGAARNPNSPDLAELKADIAATLNDAERAAIAGARVIEEDEQTVEQKFSPVPVIRQAVTMVPVAAEPVVEQKPRPFLNADRPVKKDFGDDGLEHHE